MPEDPAAKRWAINYCEFAGYSREEAEEIYESGKVEEKCGKKVRKTFKKWI